MVTTLFRWELCAFLLRYEAAKNGLSALEFASFVLFIHPSSDLSLGGLRGNNSVNYSYDSIHNPGIQLCFTILEDVVELRDLSMDDNWTVNILVRDGEEIMKLIVLRSGFLVGYQRGHGSFDMMT